MLTFDQAVQRARDLSGARLIGIDGLPLAGKSTLAERLARALSGDCLFFDDFVLPQAQWPADIAPGFPFPYMRHAAFVGAVTALAKDGRCVYRPYDWETGQLAVADRALTTKRPVIVEGVSALQPALAACYDLRIWVESDAATTLAASHARGVGAWAREWAELFLPSVEHYLETRPRERAHLVVAGRGAG